MAQEDLPSAWASYRSFGQMAIVRGRKRALEYAMSLGLDDVDGVGSGLDDYLRDSCFDGFRNKDGQLLDSWSRHKVAGLAESSPDPMRKAQYDHYYRTWSEQAHANPSALVGAMLPQDSAGAVEQIRQEVYGETRKLIIMLITLFAD